MYIFQNLIKSVILITVISLNLNSGFAGKRYENSPVTHDETSPVSLILLNPMNDDTFVISLEENVLEFSKRPKNITVDILKKINIHTEGQSEALTSINTFRWSLVGGIDNVAQYLGHLGSYHPGIKPWHDGGWKLRQRIKRLNYLYDAADYGGVNNSISVRPFGTPGHWEDLWQGSYDALGGNFDMQARVGHDSNMVIWSLFAFEGIYEGDDLQPYDWNKISMNKLGVVSLSPEGILRIHVE